MVRISRGIISVGPGGRVAEPDWDTRSFSRQLELPVCLPSACDLSAVELHYPSGRHPYLLHTTALSRRQLELHGIERCLSEQLVSVHTSRSACPTVSQLAFSRGRPADGSVSVSA